MGNFRRRQAAQPQRQISQMGDIILGTHLSYDLVESSRRNMPVWKLADKRSTRRPGRPAGRVFASIGQGACLPGNPIVYVDCADWNTRALACLTGRTPRVLWMYQDSPRIYQPRGFTVFGGIRNIVEFCSPGGLFRRAGYTSGTHAKDCVAILL